MARRKRARTVSRRRRKSSKGRIVIPDAVCPGLTTICPKGTRANVPGYKSGGLPNIAAPQVRDQHEGRC